MDDSVAAPSHFPQRARWIQAPYPDGQDRYRAPVLFTTFRPGGPVRAATLRCCGLGLQDVTIDGGPVDDHRLDPPFSNYDVRVYYVTDDVTDKLSADHDHELAITLGRGFFAVPTPNVWNWHRAGWSGPLRAIAELRLEYVSGEIETIATDTDWRATLSRTTLDCYYAGESYYATLGVPEPMPAARADPPGGTLEATRHEPVRVTWTGSPTWHQAGNAWVADFGRTLAGWVSLRTHQEHGVEVSMRYGEATTADGLVDPHSVHVDGDRFQIDTYVGDGSPDQSWQPRFTYKGFRYVQVDGLTHPPDGSTLTAHAAHNDVATVGDFGCSEPLFETFVQAMGRSIVNNLHHIPTDTPMYEKNGWTGDAQVGAATMLGLFDLGRLLTKWLGDLRDSQRDNGAIPVIVPSAGWGYTDLAPSPEWTTVYPYLVRELYRHYGDRRLIDDHWSALVRYLDWELGKLVNGCAVSELGDYLQPGTHGVGADDSGVTASSYLIRALGAAAELGALIGADPDRQRFADAAAAIRSAMNTRFFDSERGRYQVGPGFSQTSNAVPLTFGLVPAGFEQTVADQVAADVSGRGNHLHVGCLGAVPVLRTLTEHGYGRLAYDTARQTDYPSWGHWFALGADTMWEMWGADSRSRDHYFQGTVAEWLITDVAGVRCGDHGWQQLEIAPHPVGDLESAHYAIDTVRGRVAAEWHREPDASGDHDFRLTVTVPPGAGATVIMPGISPRADAPNAAPPGPDGRFTVPAGSHEFTSQLVVPAGDATGDAAER